MTTKVPRNTKSELRVAAVKLGLVKTISHLFFFSLWLPVHIAFSCSRFREGPTTLSLIYAVFLTILQEGVSRT
jgi:hypothetical protein